MSGLGWTVGGLGVVFAALAVLLAMVIRLFEPSLLLSLLAYAGLFAGALMTVVGARRFMRR